MIHPTPDWVARVESLSAGIDHSYVVMDENFIASALYCLNREDGSLQWQFAPTWPRWFLEPFALCTGVLIATKPDEGIYRLDAVSGAPLLVNRPDSIWGHLQEYFDRRSLKTTEGGHAKPLIIRDGEIVTYMGSKVDVMSGKTTGKVDDLDLAREAARAPVSKFQRDGVLELGSIGLLHGGEPFGDNKYPTIRWPLDWYCTNDRREIVWHWTSRDLSAFRLHDAYRSLKLSVPFAYLFLMDKDRDPRASYPARYYIAAIDLRTGQLKQLVQVGDGPLGNSKLDALDCRGAVVRSKMPKSDGVEIRYYQTTSSDIGP